MPLIRDGALVDDPWTVVDDDQQLPAGPVIVSLARWQAERDGLADRNGPLGLVLSNADSPDALAGDIGHFEVICLEFPKFTDGRAYSHARKLRERYGYRGELRAVGNILRDQFFFMQRCGFDSFEVAGPSDAAGWLDAVNEISVAYQGAADDRESVFTRRHRAAR